MELKFFVHSNSAKGFVSYEKENFKDIKETVNLNCSNDEMNKIREALCEKNDVLTIHNCLDNSIYAIIIPHLKKAVLKSDKKPSAPALAYLEEGYAYLKDALKIHDDWEKIYIHNMDTEKLNHLAKETCKQIYGNNKKDRNGCLVNRFFGALSYLGSVDYISNLTEGIAKRYLIKGRPGTGKSTFLKKIVALGVNLGFEVEVYHCAFDPDSLDLVIIRELGICIFDSTAPHEYCPERISDEIIDFYAIAVNENTDEIYKNELLYIESNYKDKIMMVRRFFTLAKQAEEEEEEGLNICGAVKNILEN